MGIIRLQQEGPVQFAKRKAAEIIMESPERVQLGNVEGSVSRGVAAACRRETNRAEILGIEERKTSPDVLNDLLKLSK